MKTKSVITVPNVVFSLKTFGAAMLAYWIALRFDLERPYWAVGTVYLVAHPLTGAITSKAVYRLAGTAIGAVMTVLLVPNLVNSPELLTLAFALWMGLCLYVSLLDRSPRSYVFMLAGYTVVLAGLPLVDTPAASFDVAVARVEEIALGITCSALVSRIFLPSHAGPVLAVRVDAWLANAARLADDALAGQAADDRSRRVRQSLASDIVDLRNLTTHVAYDTSSYAEVTRDLRVLLQQMTRLLPLLSTIEDHVAALSQAGPYPDRTGRWLTGWRSWIRQTSEAEGEATPPPPPAAVAAAEKGTASSWPDMLAANLALRLDDFAAVWETCLALRRDLGNDTKPTPAFKRPSVPHTATSLHIDHGMALLSALAVVVATLGAAMFWIASAWPNGATAAQLAGVFCCIMATLDDPVPALRTFLLALLGAVAAAFVYEFALMPVLDGFAELALALGLFLIPAGVLMASPSHLLIGLALCVDLPFMLALQSQPSFDLEAFLNANIATVTGVLFAMVTLALVRSIGAEASARRLLRAGWTDIVALTRSASSPKISALTHRMTDRLGLLAPRLAVLPPNSDVLAHDLLKDLRVGLNIAEIQRNDAEDPGRLLHGSLDPLLSAVADYYGSRLSGDRPVEGEVLARVDDCLNELRRGEGATVARVQSSLVGLRLGLTPMAPARAGPISSKEPGE
ncbi:FUSC family protein [Sphingobium sp. H39-3-25]|uniref:FUSC family protein n=1 Tax=Sphingobium arseniciresistens TaxID=3030834 RepID=UPI000A04804E|nr:FUSC family protein [Sphingobium arseniciresistens]